MLFNSLTFLVFLPIVFLLYWFVFKPLRWQNIFVIAASYVFYGWWDWRFLFLIILTTLLSFACGLGIAFYESKGQLRQAKVILSVCIIFNLGILGFFKYFNFFVENMVAILSLVGIHPDWPTLNILLPVGISFYTFQALSYPIDVYRRQLKATNDLAAFAAYISFFPQLVAGPIERATHLLPQFYKSRQFSYPLAVDGCRQMLWGFVKKMVIADNCAVITEKVWNDYTNLPGLSLFMGALLFTIQIYCDFSGYSDIAIGTGKLFGIRLVTNFRTPYLSTSIPEFWRRWHISLMTWFKDYVYIPLGGSHKGKWRHLCNVFAVFALSGFWHGANWTYVMWGLYHAVFFIPFILLGISGKQKPQESGKIVLYKRVFKVSITFFIVMIGWVIFRAPSLSDAVNYFSRLFSPSLWTDGGFMGIRTTLFSVLLIIAEIVQSSKEHVLQIDGQGIFRYRTCRWLLYVFMLAILILFCVVQRNFIYFQF